MQRIGCLEADMTAAAAREGMSHSTLQLKHLIEYTLQKLLILFSSVWPPSDYMRGNDHSLHMN